MFHGDRLMYIDYIRLSVPNISNISIHEWTHAKKFQLIYQY